MTKPLNLGSHIILFSKAEALEAAKRLGKAKRKAKRREMKKFKLVPIPGHLEGIYQDTHDKVMWWSGYGPKFLPAKANPYKSYRPKKKDPEPTPTPIPTPAPTKKRKKFRIVKKSQ